MAAAVYDRAALFGSVMFFGRGRARGALGQSPLKIDLLSHHCSTVCLFPQVQGEARPERMRPEQAREQARGLQLAGYPRAPGLKRTLQSAV